MIKKIIFFSTTILILFSGCSTSDNPREGGFFGGLSALKSGAYDKRIENRKSKLNEQNKEKTALAKENTDLKIQSATIENQLKTEKVKYAELINDLAKLESEVNNKKAIKSDQKIKLASIKKKIATQRNALQQHQKKINLAEQSKKEDEIRALEIERNKKRSELEALQELFNNYNQLTR